MFPPAHFVSYTEILRSLLFETVAVFSFIYSFWHEKSICGSKPKILIEKQTVSLMCTKSFA